MTIIARVTNVGGRELPQNPSLDNSSAIEREMSPKRFLVRCATRIATVDVIVAAITIPASGIHAVQFIGQA